MYSVLATLLATIAVAVGAPIVVPDTEISTKREVLAAQTMKDPFIETINQVRTQSGASGLIFDNNLRSVTETRASDMVAKQYYAHTTPEGSDFSDLLLDKSVYACENLQMQSGSSINQAIDAWLNSDSHRKCLLNQELKTAAVSIEKFNTASGGDSYVFVFIGSN